MNALSMESVFLILSGAVLAAGILYWFWSHLQLMQKKVQLLENAVFELRGLGLAPTESHTQNVPEYKDEDEGEEEEGAESEEWPAPPMHGGGGGGSTPLSALDAAPVDLQPGGRLEVPVLTPIAEEETAKDVQFRELFIQHEARIPTPVPSSQGESLEAMPVKELRRLAEQRGLTGVSDMRKKDLLAALRSQVTLPDTAVATSPNPSTEVTVERTLDLTDDAVVLE